MQSASLTLFRETIILTKESCHSCNLFCKSPRMVNGHISSRPQLTESQKDILDKKVSIMVSNIKICTRSCLTLFSSKRHLPTELMNLLSTLKLACTISIIMNSNHPTVKRVDKIREVMSDALFHARRFRGREASNDVIHAVQRVKRIMTAGVEMVKVLIKVLEYTRTESNVDDDSDSEVDSELDSDSGDSSTEEESGSDSEESARDEESKSDSEGQEMVSETENPTKTCTPGSSASIKLPAINRIQHGSCHIQDKPILPQPHVKYYMLYAPPRLPENCKTTLSANLSKLLWETRRKVEEKQAKDLLHTTRKSCTQGFKNKVQSQVKSSISKSSGKLTVGTFSSLMGDLVDVKSVKCRPTLNKPQSLTVSIKSQTATVSKNTCSAMSSETVSTLRLSQASNGAQAKMQPRKHATETPKNSLKCTVSKSQVSSQAQPIVSTEELATSLNNSFPSLKYEHQKLVDDLTEQLSKSSIGAKNVKPFTSNTLQGTKDLQLKDGHVKFILRSSPLTVVLEQRKKNVLVLPKFEHNCSTGQLEAVKPRKANNLIKESQLTAIVNDKVTMQYHVKMFADKMQQTLMNELKTTSHIRPAGSMGRVFLTAKRTKTSLSAAKTPMNNHNTPKACSINTSTSRIGYGLALGTSIKSEHKEPITRVTLGKRSSSSLTVEHPRSKQVKCN